MLPRQVEGLTEPAGVADALEVVDGVDATLVGGVGRLTDESVTALDVLAVAMGATPLAAVTRGAIDAIVAGSVRDDHLAVLAGARAALFGAVHDALLTQFDGALGRSRANWPGNEDSGRPTESDVDRDPALAGARSWLRDVAIAGWRGVDDDLVAGSDQSVRALLAQPPRRRLAVLLDGFAAELRACAPIAKQPQVAARRWADLWTRSMLLAQPGAAVLDAAGAATVSGRLLVLGADVQEHATIVQVQVHAVLESAGAPPRLVRTSVAAGKVETIVGPAVWPLLHRHPTLMRALAEHRGIEITDMALLDSGDLLWADDRAAMDEPTDPFTTARVVLPAALGSAVSPLDRHPVRVAEPVLVEDYQVADDALVLGDQRLPLALDGLPAAGPLTPATVAASLACLGLLRWDQGGWRLQPFAVRAIVKKKTVTVQTTDWAMGPTDSKLAKASGDAVVVLRERAGRLLRR